MAHVINASTFMIGAGDRVEQATPLIKIDPDGKITAEAVQKEGYVKGGTKTTTKQLDTAEGGNITPSKEEQTPARAGEFLKADLVVLPIPSDYIIPKGTETITENGEYNVREAEKVLIAVNKGVDAPDVPQAVPSITVSDSGLITATAVQEGGLVPSGTKTATKQLTTQEGKIITPTESEQTAVEDNRYTTGAVKVAPIPSEYLVGDEITEQEGLITDIEELVAKVGGGTSVPNTDLEGLMAHYKDSLKSNNTRLANIVKALEEKTFVGKYSLEIEILDYEGNPMSMSGYYYKPQGAETYFSGDTTIPNIANEETVLYIVILNAGSPSVSGYGCSITYDINITEIDGIEYYACEITAQNFTNDALIIYQES